MIKKAGEKDKRRLLDYANKRASENLFIVGDIESYGFDKEYQDIWYEEINGRIEAIYLKYRDNFVLYSESNHFDPKAVANLIFQNGINYLNGLASCVATIHPYIEALFVRQNCYYCVLDDQTKLIRENQSILVKETDLDAIAELVASIKEFNYTKEKALATVKRNFDEHAKQSIIKIDDQIVTYAAVTVESSTAGMIVSVCSAVNYRNQGYATKNVSSLVKQLVKENKSACLFYDNPSAGSIYHAIGFKTVDEWVMYKRKEIN